MSIIGIGVGIPAENVQVVQIKKVLSELNNKRIDMELDIRVLIGEICTRWEKRDLFIGLAKSISYQRNAGNEIPLKFIPRNTAKE